MSGDFQPPRRPANSPSRPRVMARPAGASLHPQPPYGSGAPLGHGPYGPPGSQVAPARSLRRWVGPIVIGALVLVAGALILSAPSPDSTPETPGPTMGASPASPAASVVAAPATMDSALSRRPSRPSPSAPIESPIAAATGSPIPIRGTPGSPRRAAEFDQRAQAIAIEFPLREESRYRYRDTFLDRREGSPEPYNHVLRRDGAIVRAHDGADIYARLGAPVLAPFDGIVLDPAQRWQPWDPDRYGLTATIVSTQPTSDGYTALLAHLDRLWVEPGQTVEGGDVIGTVGNTGNAEGVEPHLHFELRAPFGLTWQEAGGDRTVDAFNPYPSLVAADPRRRP